LPQHFQGELFWIGAVLILPLFLKAGWGNLWMPAYYLLK
jgi:hypothetical protein